RRSAIQRPRRAAKRPRATASNSVQRRPSGDYQKKGVTGVGVHVALVGKTLPSKVMAKALRAGFQRFIQRLRPLPVGSRLRTTRFMHSDRAGSLRTGRGALVARRKRPLRLSIAWLE